MSNYIKNVMEVISWVNDRSDRDFIASPGYDDSYLSIHRDIATDELDILVDTVNSLLILDDSDIRVCWVSGEIRPVEDSKKFIVDEELKNDIELHLFIELGRRR